MITSAYFIFRVKRNLRGLASPQTKSILNYIREVLIASAFRQPLTNSNLKMPLPHNQRLGSLLLWSAAACRRFRKREQAPALQKLLTANRVSAHGKCLFTDKFLVEWLVVPSRKILLVLNKKWNYFHNTLPPASLIWSFHAVRTNCCNLSGSGT